MKGISAVVATYQRKDELQRLFDSVLENIVPDLELIIVDQNRDGLLDELIESYSTVLSLKHIKLTEANQSRARNVGAAQARFGIICFPDDDCWFERGAFAAVERHFEENSDTELLIINWAQAPGRIETSQALTRNEVFSFRSVGYVTYVQFYRAEAFRSLGGFLEDVGIGRFIGGGEDSELTFRALQRGMRVYYEAGIRVNHHYIPVQARAHHIIRARQRGMGMVYAAYDIPYYVIFRGMVAPLLKMVVAMNRKKSGEFYNIFRGRLEGFVYTLRNRRRQHRPATAHL
ncbi:glycosyltransferase family 2 protein [Flaviaesturariibacter flavus]|uniref:Glycosyltransferase family 2 protein n=1 Tax=Flaviaesturariibacter flavus TaxID=2502780 RepID=A0A4R1BP17_9BACT|nr:glycosyltransferase family A protein [Flaviaesturariibacter flavus]TCJ19319.1 glycosyltransferase family 2 protein [Flaviaesturariibacter flavus]